MTISAAADSATAAANQFFGAQGLDHVLTAVGLLLCLAGGLVVNYGARLLACGVGLGLGFALGAVMATVIKLTDDQTAIALLATSLTGAVAGLIAAKAVSTLVFGATGLLFGGLLGRVAAETWAKGAVPLLRAQWGRRPATARARLVVTLIGPLDHPWSVDGDNGEAAILDALTAAGVLEDDGPRCLRGVTWEWKDAPTWSQVVTVRPFLEEPAP